MLCIAIEELARVDHSMAITLEAGVGLGANPIHRFGTEEQKQTWLPDLCAGRTLGGFGLTEPEAGQRRRRHPHHGRARRGGGGVGDQRREGVHHQLGHRDHRRSSPSRPAPARARSARSSCRRAPRASRCSRPTGRWAGTRPTPTGSPSSTPACPRTTCSASGAAGSPSSSRSSTRGASPSPRSPSACIQACLEHCTQYAHDRHAFGRPIGANQGVAFQVADLAVMAETARLLTYQAAWLHDTGRPCKQAAAMAKLHTTEAAVAGDPHRHPGVRRLRVHRRDARSPGSTATPRSSRSARAPARSSGW